MDEHLFGFLLRRIAPLVVAPVGPLPPAGFQLRGVVRAGHTRARVVFSPDARRESGIGYEFTLSEDGVDAAIDWLRITVSAGVTPTGGVVDSHGNTVGDAAEHGFRPTGLNRTDDHNVFSLLSTLVHGGGSPWFEDEYTCAGFMLGPSGACRVYVRVAATGEVYGLHLPMEEADGTNVSGKAGSLPSVLGSLIDNGTLFTLPVVDTADDYCRIVYDLGDWI